MSSPNQPVANLTENEVFVVPASSVQGRYWLLDRLSPGAAAYNSPIVMRMTGILDVEVLKRTLNDIVSRHEALRTTFRIENGLLMQVIASELCLPLPVADLSSTSQPEVEAETQRLIQQHGSISLNLTGGPLIQCKLLRISAENHILLITTHQIVSDGWSNGILVREIAVTYEAFAKRKPTPLPAPQLQYADFAIWHNEWLGSDHGARARDYWVRKLDCELPALELPTDRPRTAGKIFPGAVESLLLPEPLVEKLKHYASEQSTTLYVTLLGAFQILMKCYSRQERFVITSSSAGRSQPGLDETFGRFAHPQIILADLTGDPTFEALTGRIQNWCTDAWGNQDFPLEKILEALGTEREDFQAPALHAYFVFQKAFMHIHRTETLTITPMLSVVGGASVDIGFGVVERLEGTRVHVEYNRELFDSTTIQRLLAQYKNILQASAENPRCRVSGIPVLRFNEREKMLVEWNQTSADYSKETCVHELVERQAEAVGDRIAVTCGGQRRTYRQLNARANQIAWHLRRLGVEPDDRIGVCMDRSIEMLAGLLGILKAGGAYVPLDANHPPARQTACLQEAGAAILLTRRKYAGDLRKAACSQTDLRLVCLESETAIDEESCANLPRQTDSSNLAYVIFTSGSTGRPKGVRITHRSFVNLLQAIQRIFALSSADVLVAVTTISFDIAGLELFAPLISGARTVIATEDQSVDPGAIRELFTETGTTVFQATPHFWSTLIESGWEGDGRLKMLCGGEAMSRKLADALLDRGGELWNLYGPTETTIWSSALRIERGTGTVPIGAAIANTRFYVLDENLDPVPIGVPGELYIGGDGVASGYQSQPELTRAKFLRNRFVSGSEARMYRTGDLVKPLPNGTFEFLGRLDTQIKIRGFRIEPGEIESALQEQPGVGAAVVVKCKNRLGDNCLAAYVTVHAPAETSRYVENLHTLLRSRLPEHMQPSSITAVDRFPLTTSGKIDRNRLAEMQAPSLARAADYRPPGDAIEARLVEIWERVLRIHTVGVRTSFFDLGGYSLTVVRLFAQINKTFDRNLPIATIFSSSTIEKLADVIRGETVSRSLVPIQRDGNKEPLFAVHSYLLYGGLRRILGGERPLYGLQELEDDKGRVFRLEDRVETYLREIRTVQPHGPYHLIGWCAAGTLTLEVARALLTAGDEVRLLGLIDASRPGYAAEVRKSREGVDLRSRVSAKWRSHRDELTSLSAAEKGTYLLHVLMRHGRVSCRRIVLRYWKLIYRQCKRFGIAPPDFMHNVSWVTFASMHEHRFQPYAGPITLFRASSIPKNSDPASHADVTLGWQDVATQKVEVIWVPGDHESMFRDPNLAVFGKRLKEAIEPEGAIEAELGSHAEQLV